MVVTVHALFSNRDLIGSKLISLGTKHLTPKEEDIPSHVAVLVNGRWVHESTGDSGVRVISYDIWSKINKEVNRIQLQDIEYQQIADKYREIKGKGYDYLGLTFFAIAIIPTFFGIDLPKKNLLESKDKYFCCEVLGYLTNKYYGMSAPTQIMVDLHGKT